MDILFGVPCAQESVVYKKFVDCRQHWKENFSNDFNLICNIHTLTITDQRYGFLNYFKIDPTFDQKSVVIKK